MPDAREARGQHLPAAVHLPTDPGARPVSARELSHDARAVRSNEEYLFDYSPSEMARHRGTGAGQLADLDERQDMTTATMLPPD